MLQRGELLSLSPMKKGLLQVKAAVAFIQEIVPAPQQIGVVLGSGLGNFIQELAIEHEIPYADIPHFPVTTVAGHTGKLVFGKLGDKQVVVMAGRFHYYEGYQPDEIIFPIRVLKFLGVQQLIISNAAGGVNRAFRVGDLMIIQDHISQFTVNPLLGPNDDLLGPRFPDMTEPYSKTMIAKAKKVAAHLNIPVQEGVYVGVTGPTFETKAEYKMIQMVGGDAVGMSTVQEVIAAVHMGMEVFAMSVITDLGIREENNVITHEEVLREANAAEPKMTAIVKQLILDC